jgi:hypothetical protein
MTQPYDMNPPPQPPGLSDEDKWNIARVQSLIFHKVSGSMGDHYAMFPCDRPVRGPVVTRENERER